jgi:transcriptional regulator of acetoin/glycerol metabolism
MSIAGQPVPDTESRIANSWRRSLVDHKLDPARPGPPLTLTAAELRDSVAPMDEVLQFALPEFDALFAALRDSGYCVNLADANAAMLTSRLPNGEAGALFRQWKVYTGSIFAESIEGTNGVGTALAERRPIIVHRDEHFRAQWSMFTCAVAPIFDHVGDVAGALNITSSRADLDKNAHKLALALTVQSAERIEEAIFRARYRHGWIVRMPADRGGGRAMVAFDDSLRVLGACRTARRAFRLSEQALTAGVALSDFIRLGDALKPSDTPQLFHRADGAKLGYGSLTAPTARSARQHHRAKPPAPHPTLLMRLAGNDPGLQRSAKRLAHVAAENIPILLRGETGSGKDAFARAIHAGSSRSQRSYVALNCAAMPESLIDAELFGYEAGAFTGARRDGFKGLIVQADGGTLFLDEIGDMPLALQTRLLRVLENREVRPLGGLTPLPVDIRLISATHRDLEAMIGEGAFRADLYYRLCGLQVNLPALRERGDKAEIIDNVAGDEAPGLRLSPGARAALMAHAFPGNIRQLRHVLRLAACTVENGCIEETDLDLPPAAPAAERVDLTGLDAAERDVIAQTLRRHGGSVAAAAKALRLSRATLYRKIKALDLARS